MPGARWAIRAPSLHHRETPIKASSTKTSNESDLDTPDLKGNKLVKEKMQKIRKLKKGKEAYM